MAKKTKRVPSELSLFDIYLKGVFNMLSSMYRIAIPPIYWWQQLGLTSDEMDKMKEFLTQWWSGDPGNPGVYEIHTNAYTVSKTIKASRKNVVKFMKDFSAFFAPLLIRMDGSPNITSNIRLILNIADPNPPRKKHIDQIIASCFAKVISKQGGIVKLKCTTDSDASRASMLKNEGAIEIEVIYCLKAPTIDDKGNLIPPPPPTSSEDPTLNITEISTKASFFLTKVTASSVGKTLQGYSRWRDIHNPKRFGPFTPLPATLVN